MKQNYEERAQKFIAQINPYIKECRRISEFEFAVCKFNREHHRKVRMCHGATRIAFITSDYVIKINYRGWGSGRFGGCADEVKMYKKAKQDGFEHLFAKITPVRKGYGRTYYIMPRINGIGRTDEHAEEYLVGDEWDYVVHNVGDRHNENYGWKDGHIILIDYAYNSFVF